MRSASTPVTENVHPQTAASVDPADGLVPGDLQNPALGAGALGIDSLRYTLEIDVHRKDGAPPRASLSGLVPPGGAVRAPGRVNDGDADLLAQMELSAIMPLMNRSLPFAVDPGRRDDPSVKTSASASSSIGRPARKHLVEETEDQPQQDPAGISALLAASAALLIPAKPPLAGEEPKPHHPAQIRKGAENSTDDLQPGDAGSEDGFLSYSRLLRLMTALTAGISLVLKAVNAEVAGLNEGNDKSSVSNVSLPGKSRRRLKLK